MWLERRDKNARSLGNKVEKLEKFDFFFFFCLYRNIIRNKVVKLRISGKILDMQRMS